MSKSYSSRDWKVFRAEVIELDGGRCRRCEWSSSEGAVLQVHHLRYIRGKKPWEYAYSDCETLCKGCHAEEHGFIRPSFGWDYLGDSDLGELSGNCEACGTEIRYVFYIQHPDWEPLAVGTICCDNLTGTKEASNRLESIQRFESRLARFITSSRWEEVAGACAIRQKGLVIQIQKADAGFRISMNHRKGRDIFGTLGEAKKKAFEVIENGRAKEYLSRFA